MKSFIAILFSIMFSFGLSVSVCSLSTLKLELIQDINDNGSLDCLRVIPPPTNQESELEKNKRLAAQWDSSCSFESTQDWIKDLRINFKVNNLVTATGEPYESNDPNQADMCEIVRSLIKRNYPNVDMTKLNSRYIEGLQCPGGICAATQGSFFDKEGWNIFLNKNNVISISGYNKKQWVRIDN